MVSQSAKGTDAARFPFWSPDNRSVGFFADSKLKRIDVDGESVRELARVASGGGAWNQENVILFAVAAGVGGIFRVSATGGTPSPVTHLEPKQTGHSFPHFLPGGRRFLYYAQGSLEVRGIYIAGLDGSETQRLLEADTAAEYAASSGQLLFVRQGTLFAQAFDPDRVALKGDAVRVAEQVAVEGIWNQPALSASAAGPIVYRPGSTGGQRQLVWFDRSGKETGKVGGLIAGATNPSMSLDGRIVALNRTLEGNSDIWVLDTAPGFLHRFTFDPAGEITPVLSPDGTRIAFASSRRGAVELYVKSVNGSPGSEELLLPSKIAGARAVPVDWSRDGRFLLYRNVDPKTGSDLWALPMDSSQKPIEVVRTPSEDRDGQFSPDGEWIAYQSNESGRFEIYLQPFRDPGGKVGPISTNGGAQVRWRGDGRELFYIALDGQLMSVPIRFAPYGRTVDPDTPVRRFATRIGGAVQGPFLQQYVVSEDGERFLMNTLTEEAPWPITVILNWKPKPDRKN